MGPAKRFLSIGIAIGAAELVAWIPLIGTVLGWYFWVLGAVTVAIATVTAPSTQKYQPRIVPTSGTPISTSATPIAMPMARKRFAGRMPMFYPAASTSAPMTRLASSSSGCHRTPSTNRCAGSSIASTVSSVTAPPVAASPSPSRSTPWW